MSKNEKVTENKEQTEQKVMTKYDRKVQKRKEEKEKEKKEERISTAIGIVVLVALVCLVASFPIRTYLATHETYVVVNGEAVNKVEFDYQYNLTKNNYITQYGSYLTYFGLDTSKDLSTQMYSDTLTWQDYFEQNAVESLKQNKALMAEAKAAGFTYDTTDEYNTFKETIKTSAAAAGVSDKEYVRSIYGSYATMGRIEEYVKNDMVMNAYYQKLQCRGLSYFRTVSVCTGYRRCPHPDRSPDWDTGTSDPGYVRVVHSGGSFPRLFLSGTGCPGLSGRIFLYRTSGQPLCRSSSLFICIAGSPCHPFCRSRKTDTDSGQSTRQRRKICSRRNENHSVCRAFR